jgi:hypothetical protein
MTKRKRAIELRDMALFAIKALGVWKEKRGGPNCYISKISIW